MPKVAAAVQQTAITSLVAVLGHGEIFKQIKSEIEKTNKDMPNATGADKRAKVLADLKIIFDDLVVPVAESVLNLLIELAVAYLKTKA